MKQRYFTPENIQSTSEKLLDEFETVKSQPIKIKEAALLVLDMQAYFLEPDSHAFVPSAPAILPQIQKLISTFARIRQPVIFTRHINTPEDAGAMSRWWRDLITAENPLSVIAADLATDGYPVLQKTQYDAFHSTDLEEMLRHQNISQVMITGVMTHLCCETTARSAFVRGFDVFFAVAGTATYNQKFHAASLRNLAHGFAAPVLTVEILTLLESHAD